MIPLHILMDVEENPILTPEEKRICNGELHKLEAVGVMQKGTAEGAPVVWLRVDLPDGSTVLAQTSLRLFLAAARAFAARYGWQE